MAIEKRVQLTSLSIEVKTGEDKAGDPIYSKKTFSGVRNGADPQKAYAVSNAIKAVIAAETRFAFLNESSNLINAAN